MRHGFRGGGGGGHSRGRHSDSGPREMHQAVCSDCGTSCSVPFQPDPDRPVYCSNCFQNHRKPRHEGGGHGGHRERRSDQGSFGGSGGESQESEGEAEEESQDNFSSSDEEKS